MGKLSCLAVHEMKCYVIQKLHLDRYKTSGNIICLLYDFLEIQDRWIMSTSDNRVEVQHCESSFTMYHCISINS